MLALAMSVSKPRPKIVWFYLGVRKRDVVSFLLSRLPCVEMFSSLSVLLRFSCFLDSRVVCFCSVDQTERRKEGARANDRLSLDHSLLSTQSEPDNQREPRSGLKFFRTRLSYFLNGKSSSRVTLF
jgi:hypothetical protein